MKGWPLLGHWGRETIGKAAMWKPLCWVALSAAAPVMGKPQNPVSVWKMPEMTSALEVLLWFQV